MLAFLHRRSGHRCVQVVGSTHNNGIQVFLLLKQLTEVTVGRTAMTLAGALLSTVLTVDDFLARFATRNARGDCKRVA
jgi:hypothetical protein